MLFVLSALVLVSALGGVRAVPLTVLYDTAHLDGPVQQDLRKGVFMGLRDSDPDDELQPTFIDLGKVGMKQGVDWVVGNGTSTLLSLLTWDGLSQFGTLYAKRTQAVLHVFTPRSIDSTLPPPLRVRSLQMSGRAKAVAVLHRMWITGIREVVPVLDQFNENQKSLLKDYVTLGSALSPPIYFRTPLIPTQGFKISSHLSNATAVLLLASKSARKALDEGSRKAAVHHFRWFTHEPLHDRQALAQSLMGLYSAQYVGGSNWDNAKRRRLLRQFSAFTGSNPSILMVVLAYDTALVAGNHARGVLRLPMTGLSGEIQFDEQGSRSAGVFLGLSAVPQLETESVTIVQPSKWSLEDLLNVVSLGDGEVGLGEYQHGSSSVFLQEELLNLAKEAKQRQSCSSMDMEVTTHDPFTQSGHTFHFAVESLPRSLLIPNQYGYTLLFQCATNDSLASTYQVACHPAGRSISDSVHCYNTRTRLRQKRSAPFYARSQMYAWPRDDSAGSSYYYEPPPMPMNTYYTSSYAGYDSSTPATMTTRLDVPISEEPITPAPPAPGPSKLPELRQVLKAAKPFVGSCIGSTTGCAVCVLVLGRLPLGAVPAACTGPCFVGTFGTCGSLLGRVFSETTVICTELFRQGFLDGGTFLLDAQFGRQAQQESPMTFLGYQVLARPIVSMMQESELVTSIVSKFAIPWAEHMTYSIGHSEDPNIMGYWVNTLGAPVCGLVGISVTAYRSLSAGWSEMEPLGVTGGLVATFLALVSTHTLLVRRTN